MKSLQSQRRDQADAAFLPLVQCKCRSLATSRTCLQPWKLSAYACAAESNRALVAHEFERQIDEDRCQGRQPRSLRYVSDGGGGDPACLVRFGHAAHRYSAVAPESIGGMNALLQGRAGAKRREICALMTDRHALQLARRCQALAPGGESTRLDTDRPAPRRECREESVCARSRGRVIWGIAG